MLELHEFFRSGTSFRVRIALNLKGLEYRHVGVHLRRSGGEHRTEAYARLNPQRLVPTLVDDGQAVIQSLAIIEYLDEIQPEPALLPQAPFERARVRALAQVVACDMHPLNNLRVLEYLRGELGQDEEGVNRWVHTWQAQGFHALEGLLSGHPHTGRYCHGDTPSLADICLVPQVIHAQRFGFDVSRYPTVWAIHQRCLELDAFQRALPDRQPDAE